MKEISKLCTKALALMYQSIKVTGILLVKTLKKIWKVIVLIMIVVLSIITLGRIKKARGEATNA